MLLLSSLLYTAMNLLEICWCNPIICLCHSFQKQEGIVFLVGIFNSFSHRYLENLVAKAKELAPVWDNGANQPPSRVNRMLPFSFVCYPRSWHSLTRKLKKKCFALKYNSALISRLRDAVALFLSSSNCYLFRLLFSHALSEKSIGN